MNIQGRKPRVLPLPAIFLGGAVVVLALLGAWRWASIRNGPPGPSIEKLMAATGRQTNALDKVRMALWPVVPGAMASALSWLAPVDVVAVRQQACKDLEMLGPRAEKAVPVLIKALSDPETAVRVEAARALGQIGDPARAAVQPLLTLLDVPNTATYEAAGLALARLAPEDLAVIHAFTNALTQPHRQTDAARFLTEIAWRAPLVESALLAKLQAAGQQPLTQPWLQAVLIRRLGKLENPSPAVLEMLLELLENENDVIRVAVIGAIGDMGVKVAPAIPRLVEMLGSMPKAKRPGTPTRPGIPLRHALYRYELDVPDDHEYFLWRLPRVVFSFQRGGRSVPNTQISRRIFQALGRMSGAAIAAVPLLEQEYQDESNPARVVAAVARWSIDGNCRPIIPVLREALIESSPQMDQYVFSAIRQASTRCPEAISLLIQIFSDPERPRNLRLEAIEHCARLGADALPAVEVLWKVEHGPKGTVSLTAGKARAEIEAFQNPP